MQLTRDPKQRDEDLCPSLRRLSAYRNDAYDPGRSFVVRLVWYYTSLIMFENGWLPSSAIKCLLLKLFGAKVGRGVVLHPNIRIKFPWRLSIGDHCWIGRDVWIDSLEDVVLESDVCISQGVYLCTGSHDHRAETFDLKVGPIRIQHGAWICCRAIVLGGSTVERMEVVPANQVHSTRQENSSSPSRKPR